MSRVKVFMEVANEHRTVSIGGRRRNRFGRCRLNTDNATESDCALTTKAWSTSEEPHQGVSQFDVTMPTQADGNCTVRLDFADSVPLNAHVVRPNARFTPQLLVDVGQELQKGMPPVRLPSGHTLAEALACVEICRRLGLLDSSAAEVAAEFESVPKREPFRRFIIIPDSVLSPGSTFMEGVP